ncbi:UNVERIFIED_CONTAM: KHG/KDPG aldolase [Sesamum calycinum]|uniref:KHG/KDPG aldolase n=1 Tax=Sesamum calycinum TaxID=2727403 RepID=A0AAW2RSU3_9LAMI
MPVPTSINGVVSLLRSVLEVIDDGIPTSTEGRRPGPNILIKNRNSHESKIHNWLTEKLNSRSYPTTAYKHSLIRSPVYSSGRKAQLYKYWSSDYLSAEMAIEAARAALSGGISVLEITMSTPGVFEALQFLVHEYPSASLGVGTVLDSQDAKDALKCGAKFLMSPAMVKEILDDVAEGQALYIPGAMTPTEILLASRAGAKIVKVYPVSALGGVQYIAAVKKPFPNIQMIASQGITIDSVGQYIGQGASSVVLSDAIFEKNAMDAKYFDRINQLACSAAFMGSQAVRKIRDNLS